MNNMWLVLLFSLVGIAIFYIIQFGSKHLSWFAPFIFLSIFPLLWSIRYLFDVCSGAWAKKMMQNRFFYFIIMLIGGLCLEVYLVQYDIIAYESSTSWPVNLLKVFLKSLVCAYIVRCLARFFLQTLRTERYEWKEMISLKTWINQFCNYCWICNLMINSHQNRTKRIVYNTLYLYSRMLLLMFIAFYTSRVVLDK